MLRIVCTGGPGAGKTTVLERLSELGYATGSDAARTIIRERKREGLSPRPDAQTFAEQILQKEIHSFEEASGSPTFFERGVVDVVGVLLQNGHLSEVTLNNLIAHYRYELVFIFPPWQEIYRQDEERDHTFEHAQRVFTDTLNIYRRCGYEPIEVPIGDVQARTQFVLQRSGEDTPLSHGR